MAQKKSINPKDVVGSQKSPLSVVPMNVIAEVGLGMFEGALKYGRHNYRDAGISASVYFDATMRHLLAYWEGQDLDPDSGMSHLVKAICSLVVWRDAQLHGKETDDRPPSSHAFYQELNEKAKKLIELYGDRNPKHFTVKDTVEDRPAFNELLAGMLTNVVLPPAKKAKPKKKVSPAKKKVTKGEYLGGPRFIDAKLLSR